ncbi:MAG: hypothetical protein ACYC1M_03270 [Armatimonadota bacterium]
MFGVKWTNRVLIGAAIALFGATLPAIAEVRTDDVSPTTVRVAVADGGSNPWPFLDASSMLPLGWDLVNPFATGIDKNTPGYWQMPVMAGSEVWREYDVVIVDGVMMQNPVLANSMMRGVDAGLILWVRTPGFKVVPSGEGAIVYAPTTDNPFVLSRIAMRVLRVAGTHKLKSRNTNGTWQSVNAPLLEQWGSTDIKGVMASSAADSGYIRPAIYDGVMYVVGFYHGKISLLALDMEPGRDLNGDGNPDDGILDYGVHGKEDLIWAQPLDTDYPTSEPVVYPAGDETRVALTLNDGTTLAFRGIMPGTGAIMMLPQLGKQKPATAANFPTDTIVPAPVYMGKFLVAASAVDGSGVGKISLYGLSLLTPYPDINNQYEMVLNAPINGLMTGGWVDIEGSTMPLGSDLMLYVPQKAANGAAVISSVWLGSMNEQPTSDDLVRDRYETRAHHSGMKLKSDSVKVYKNFAPVSFTENNGVITLTGPLATNDILTVDYTIDMKLSGKAPKRTDIEIADVVSSPTQRVLGVPVLDVHDTLVFSSAEPGTAGSGVSTLSGGSIYGYEEQLGAGRSRLKWRWDAVSAAYTEMVNGASSASQDYRPTVTDWMIPSHPTGKVTNFRITSPMAVQGDTAYVCGSATAQFMGASMPGTLLMAFDATPSVNIDLGETVEAGTTVSVKQVDLARSTSSLITYKRLDIRVNARTNTLNLSNLMTPASSGAMQNAISLSQPVVVKLGDNKLDSAPFMPDGFNNLLWMVFIPGTTVTRQPAISGGVVYLSAEVNGVSTVLGLDSEPLKYYPDRQGKDVPLIDQNSRGTLLMPAIGPLSLYNNATEAINTFMQRARMVSTGRYSSSFSLSDTSIGVVGENGIKLLKTLRTFVAGGSRLSQYGPEGDVYWDCDGPRANPWLRDLNLTFARASKAIPFNVPGEMLVVDTGNNRVLVMNERGNMGALYSSDAGHMMPINPISSFSDPKGLEAGGSLSLRQPVDADWYVNYITGSGGSSEAETHLLVCDQGNGRLVDLSLVRPTGTFPFTTQLEWSSSSMRDVADGAKLLNRDARLNYTRLDVMRNPNNTLAGIAAVLKGMDSTAPGADAESGGSERVYLMLRFGNNNPVMFDHFVLTMPDNSEVNVPFSEISSLQLIPRSITGNVISHYGLLLGMNARLSQDPNQSFRIGILVPDDPNNPTKLKAMMMFSQGDYLRLRQNTGAPAQFPTLLKPVSVRMLSNGNLLVANGSVAYEGGTGSKGYTGLVFEIDPDSTSGGVPGPNIAWWLPTIRDIPEYADRW